jgi:hypothetical protein
MSLRATHASSLQQLTDLLQADTEASVIHEQSKMMKGLMDQFASTAAWTFLVRPMNGPQGPVSSGSRVIHYRAVIKIRSHGAELRPTSIDVARLLAREQAVRTKGMSVNGNTPLIMMINWVTGVTDALRSTPERVVDSILEADDDNGRMIRALRAIIAGRMTIKFDVIDSQRGTVEELDDTIAGTSNFEIPYDVIEDFATDTMQQTALFKEPVDLSRLSKSGSCDAMSKGAVLLRARTWPVSEKGRVIKGSTAGHTWLTADPLVIANWGQL